MADYINKSGFSNLVDPLLESAGQVYFMIEGQKYRQAQIKQAQQQLEIQAASAKAQAENNRLEQFYKNWDRAYGAYKDKHPEQFMSETELEETRARTKLYLHQANEPYRPAPGTEPDEPRELEYIYNTAQTGGTGTIASAVYSDLVDSFFKSRTQKNPSFLADAYARYKKQLPKLEKETVETINWRGESERVSGSQYSTRVESMYAKMKDYLYDMGLSLPEYQTPAAQVFQGWGEKGEPIYGEQRGLPTKAYGRISESDWNSVLRAIDQAENAKTQEEYDAASGVVAEIMKRTGITLDEINTWLAPTQ